MSRFLSSILVLLLSGPAFAAVGDEAGASAPVETVGTIYIVIFGIIFVGMIVGFFVYLWMSDGKKKPEDK
jgi:hypothetical protein